MGRHCLAVGLADALLLIGGFAPSLEINLVKYRLGIKTICCQLQGISFIDQGCAAFPLRKSRFYLINIGVLNNVQPLRKTGRQALGRRVPDILNRQ